jgi:hypothetical protein
LLFSTEGFPGTGIRRRFIVPLELTLKLALISFGLLATTTVVYAVCVFC